MPNQWKDSYSLGHEKLDIQHKELFRLANYVEHLDPRVTTKMELSSLFKEFYDYMQTHFAEEEAYMKAIEYPLLEEHQKLHEDIMFSLTHILKTTKGIPELQQALKDVSHKWLVEHIINNDLKIEKWRKGALVPEEPLETLNKGN